MIMARDIVAGLGGRWTGRSGSARCPAHDDSSPSLSVAMTRDGRPLVHCFAGCKGLDVIGALKARGLWPEAEGVYRDPGYMVGFTYRQDGNADNDDRERQEAARKLWDMGLPIKGTPVETYLRSRGLSSVLGWSDGLRYLPRLKHTPSGKQFPCMLGALTDGRGQVTAVQRTYLELDGSGKASVDGPKRTLGPMRDAAVRLANPRATLGLAEGIETALSAMQLFNIPVWATLSANRLGKIKIPARVTLLTIYADEGDVGMRSAREAADEYEAAGRAVDVVPPRAHFVGAKDFNDALRAQHV